MGIIEYIKDKLFTKGDNVSSDDEYFAIYGGMNPRPVLDDFKKIIPYDQSFREPNLTTLKIARYLFNNSDVVKTIIRSIVDETIKNGIYLKPKFASKCEDCGAVYEERVDKCEKCGSTNIVEPDENEYNKLMEWMGNINENKQKLLDLLYGFAVDLNVYDNAFVVAHKKYYFKNGKVVKSEIKEIIRGSPFVMQIIMNRFGSYGRDDNGNYLMFCPKHRNKLITVKPDDYEKGNIKCPICGTEMFEAHFRAKLNSNIIVYYSGDEVYFDTKSEHSVGYGTPLLMSVWQKVMILMKMDEYVLYSYSLRRPPAGLLIIRGNPAKVYKMWKRIEEERAKNPYSLIPFAIDNPNLMKSTRPAEFIDMSYRADDINFIEYRNELRRSIGATFGVMPLFQADYSTGVGLANEGLQITVTNRVLDREQYRLNEGILKWIAKQLEIEDWEIKLVHHEEKDMKAKIEREMLRIQKAQAMKTLGYDAIMFEGEDGIDFKFVKSEEKTTKQEDNKINMNKPEDRFQGEPERGRMSSGTADRYQGQPQIVRRKRRDASDKEVEGA